MSDNGGSTVTDVYIQSRICGHQFNTSAVGPIIDTIALNLVSMGHCPMLAIVWQR